MTNEEALELLKDTNLILRCSFTGDIRIVEAIDMAIKALEENHTLNGNTLTIKVSEEGIDKIKRIMLDCAPWCRTFYEDAKDINVPIKSALDHIHNVVRDDAYKRGYEQGKAEKGPEIPLAWIESYIKTCEIFDLRANVPAEKIIKTMVKIWRQENPGGKKGGDNGKT